MRLGSLLTTLVGLGVAGGAVYYAQTQLNTVPTETAAAAPSLVRVVAVAQDVEFGQSIEPHMLTTIEWPANSVPAGAITDTALVLSSDGKDPRRAKRAMTKGELVSMEKLSDWGEKVTIVQTLAEGHRAVSITVNAAPGVGGFVTPGDDVDILMTRGNGDSLRTITILQKVRVIGVDQRADEQIDQAIVARTITVEVTPKDGQKLALAQRAGRLSLSLRSNEEVVDEPLDAVRLSDLMVEKSPQPEGAPRNIVKVNRGIGNISEQVVRENPSGEGEQLVDAVLRPFGRGARLRQFGQRLLDR